MVNITLSLVGANDDEIIFTEESQFVLTTGLSGMGIPNTVVRIDESAGDGGVWRYSKRGIRELDIPVAIFGDSRDELESNLRRLSNLLRDVDGGTTLKASYDSGEIWELKDGHYVAGAETVRGDDAGLYWCRWVLSMQFANPFWVRQQAEQVSLSTGVTGRSIIPGLAELRVSSAQAIGALTIENEGDVNAYPTWEFKGPMDSVTVTSASGKEFVYNAPIVLGDTITIDTATATVVNATNVNKYQNLGASPKLFSFPPGQSVVNIVAPNTDANTRIRVYYQPRKEVVH